PFSPPRQHLPIRSARPRPTPTLPPPPPPEHPHKISTPISYITWSAQSIDDKPHSVQVYLDATGEVAVNKVEQKVVWDRQLGTDIEVLRIGTEEQPVLAKKGDNLRIDWGYFYLSIPKSQSNHIVAAPAHQ